MRPPFPHCYDFLQVYTDEVNNGVDYQNIRDTFYPSKQAILFNTFTLPSTTTKIYGEWTIDTGDLTMSSVAREPRVFCTKGKVKFTVTGTSVYVRLQLNYGWGTASVYIDGVKPSTIVGATSVLDTISSNTETNSGYAGSPPVCIDVLVADNLSAGTHTVELYANNTVDKWLSVSGVKTRSFAPTLPSYKLYRAPVSSRLKDKSLTFANQSGLPVKNINVTLPSSFKKTDGTSFTNPITIGTLQPSTTHALQYSIDDSGMPDSSVATLTVSADYVDPLGSVIDQSAVALNVDNPGIIFTGAWGKDASGPGGVRRAFSTAANQQASFRTTETTFTIKVVREYGWGAAKVMVGAVQYGTVTSADPVGGGFLQELIVTGLPAGDKQVDLVTSNAAAKPFVFTEISFNAIIHYTTVVESWPINVSLVHIPPFPVSNPRVEQSTIRWDRSNPLAQSYANPPHDNTGIEEYKVHARFPSYCVYYQTGNEDILNQYDLLVIEPSAVTRRQVQDWQSRGIKVLGYVSLGEEDGARSDLWNLSDTKLGPHRGDGTGVGGYAPYYNKGGNLFGESSECTFDRQRVEGVKACSQGRAEYFTGTGRCSTACQHDWRDGYSVQSIGGACGKGFTSANNWQRDAMTACTNSACAQYAPVNAKCPRWTEAEVKWGQDFSIADTTIPDQNGIWASTFINPIHPGWLSRLKNDYFPTTLDQSSNHTETLTLRNHTIVGGSVLGIQTSSYPIDSGESIVIKSADGVNTYRENLDYTMDLENGLFVFDAAAGVDLGWTAPADGLQLIISYTKKGLQCDGVFMDTVDTVDVYPSELFKSKMVEVIGSLKSTWPTKYLCSNRGFGVLDDIIKYCEYVMFESFFSDYNWTTDTYKKITDPGTIEWNNGIKQQLRRLRKANKFDVLGLNYCSNGPEGDALRLEIAQECYNEGYMSWTSTILLNDPLPDRPLALSTGRIRTNAHKTIKKERFV